MNKARIVLSAVALFAVVGGALAFKMRTGFPVFTTTTAIVVDGQTYTRAGGASFVYTNPTLFFTQAPSGFQSTVLRTTAVPTTSITLTRVGGTETLLIPNYGTVTATTATRVTTAD